MLGNILVEFNAGHAKPITVAMLEHFFLENGSGEHLPSMV
jgi:hypothetical protein